MSELDLKRAKVELLRVQAAKAEMEFRIYEKEQEIVRLQEAQERIRTDEIERLKTSIANQEKREEELKRILN